jgi:hypothetical protein
MIFDLLFITKVAAGRTAAQGEIKNEGEYKQNR